MSITEEVSKLQEKAGKYEVLREEYDRLKEKVKTVVKELNILLGTEFGFVDVKKYGKRRNIIENLLLRLKEGEKITRDIIIKIYPELDEKKASDILYSLSKNPDIEKTKDGRCVRLYYRKRATVNERNELMESLPKKFIHMG